MGLDIAIPLDHQSTNCILLTQLYRIEPNAFTTYAGLLRIISSIGFSGRELLFPPTTAVFEYIDTKNTSSSAWHWDDTQCGSWGLKMSASPGLRATAIPRHGKQRYATIRSKNRYSQLGKCALIMAKVLSSSVCALRNTPTEHTKAPRCVQQSREVLALIFCIVG